MKTIYIQRRGNGYLETVDEFPANTKEERMEARRCLSEYRLSDPSGYFYISSRPCKAWAEKDKN